MLRVYSLGLLTGAALSLTGAAFAGQPTNTDEVRAVVAEMLSDAETRSSLLAGGDAGHDGKFFIAGDGFRLSIGGLEQFRYMATFNDNTGNFKDFSNGFQNRRTQLWLEGKVNKDWEFKVQGEFSDSDAAGQSSGTFNLLDAWARYSFANGMKLTWGQFKLPLLREELVADQYQLAADRSLVNYAFTQDRSQGVMLSYQAEAWRFALAFSDGLNSKNTDYTSRENTSGFQVSGQGQYAFTGRFEYMFSGNWDMFKDFTSAKGQDFGALFGLAGHFQQSDNSSNPADVDRDTFEYTADISLEGDSWNLYAAFVGDYTKNRFGGGNNTFNDFGVVVQGGWRFAQNTELFVRYDGLFLDSDRFSTGDDNFSFLTFGINQYFAGHAAKLTIDGVWSINETTNLQSLGILSNSAVGLLGDSSEGEFAVRAQFQLMF